MTQASYTSARRSTYANLGEDLGHRPLSRLAQFRQTSLDLARRERQRGLRFAQVTMLGNIRPMRFVSTLAYFWGLRRFPGPWSSSENDCVAYIDAFNRMRVMVETRVSTSEDWNPEEVLTRLHAEADGILFDLTQKGFLGAVKSFRRYRDRILMVPCRGDWEPQTLPRGSVARSVLDLFLWGRSVYTFSEGYFDHVEMCDRATEIILGERMWRAFTRQAKLRAKEELAALSSASRSVT